MGDPLADEHLLAQIALNDRTALETLYDRYERMVFSFALRCVNDRHIAEEVVQDVFTKIWKGAESYHSNQAKVTTWMLTITRRVAIDYYRKSTRRGDHLHIQSDDWLQLAATDKGPDVRTEESDLRNAVFDAMGSLSNDQRVTIERMYYLGQTQREIAEELGVPLGTVKGRIRLALAHLRERLSSKGWGDTP